MTGLKVRRGWFSARFATAVLVAMALAMGACGSGDDPASPTTTASPAVTSTPEATDTPDAIDAPDAADTSGVTEPEASDPDDSADGEPGVSSGGTLEEFCPVAAETLVVVDREFVGSDAHIDLFDRLIEVAPSEAVADLELVRDHFEHNVDPAVESSQDFVNFPADIQAAATRAQQYISDKC